MNTWALLEALVELFKAEFEKGEVYFSKKDSLAKDQLPQVYIDSLPPRINDSDWPYIVIEPPREAEDNLETTSIPINIFCGAYSSIKSEGKDGALFEVLRLVDRAREILNKNRTIGAFRLDGNGIKWGVDKISREAVQYAVGGIQPMYETVSQMPELMEEDSGY